MQEQRSPVNLVLLRSDGCADDCEFMLASAVSRESSPDEWDCISLQSDTFPLDGSYREVQGGARPDAALLKPMQVSLPANCEASIANTSPA